jgi:predicted nucleic acid-binding protein
VAEVLFDTSIIIDWLRDRPQAAAELERYGRHQISRITWIEALAGEPQESRRDLIDLLGRFQIIELDAQIALDAADFRQRSRTKLPDAVIWATARRHNLILVTRNTKDFPASMPGVRIPYTL